MLLKYIGLLMREHQLLGVLVVVGLVNGVREKRVQKAQWFDS